MRLERELMAIKADLDADTFRGVLADLFAETNRDSTAENLLCRWTDSKAFCAIVRRRLSLPETSDELILRTLLNMRKAQLLPRNGHGVGISRVELGKALAEHGCNADPEAFRKLVMGIFRKIYPHSTVDCLLTRWPDSGHFCGVIRGQFGMSNVPDYLVLGTLLNLRRQANLSLGKRAS